MLKADKARRLTLHRNDFMFGVRERVYAEIQAAALAGNIGTVIRIPEDCYDCVEYEMFVQELLDNGYDLIDDGWHEDAQEYWVQVWWGSFVES